MIDRIILVDDNQTRINNLQKSIKEASLTDNVTVTLNGGHALLYLDHINHKIKDSKILILLNIHTPIANGFEFLEGYKEAYKSQKPDIQIAVMQDNLKEEEIEKVKKFGISSFFSLKDLYSGICALINQYWSKGEDKELPETKVDSIKTSESSLPSEPDQPVIATVPVPEFSPEVPKTKRKRVKKG